MSATFLQLLGSRPACPMSRFVLLTFKQDEDTDQLPTALPPQGVTLEQDPPLPALPELPPVPPLPPVPVLPPVPPLPPVTVLPPVPTVPPLPAAELPPAPAGGVDVRLQAPEIPTSMEASTRTADWVFIERLVCTRGLLSRCEWAPRWQWQVARQSVQERCDPR